jgi:hypothetical protein
MSRVRAADMAMNRDQQAFFSKYGINTADEMAREEETVGMAADGANIRRRGGFLALFDWQESPWDFLINAV